MAYSGRYNPDALPAHAEPEQKGSRYANKPQPSTTRIQTQTLGDRAGSPSNLKSPTNQRPSAGGYDTGRPSYEGSRPSGSSYDSHGRRVSDPRYNVYDRPAVQSPRQDSYGSGRIGTESQQGNYRPPPVGGSRPPQPMSPRATSTRPPPTPQLGREDNDRDSLWPLFQQVDKDRSGQLSESELGAALVNGDYTSFHPHTVTMMIRMFDVDHSGTIDFDEFVGLWGFLSEWRKLFDRFDVDRSGTISFDEFSSALLAFGYHLSQEYVWVLFNTYDTRKRGALSFDLFVQACISLKRMTDVFKKYDQDRDGYITLSFEQFLTGAQSLFLFKLWGSDEKLRID